MESFIWVSSGEEQNGPEPLFPRSRVGDLPLELQTWCQEGFLMKMNGTNRTFVKQVQVDLLALSDADLFHMVRRWVDEKDPSGLSPDIPEETLSALGYTRVLAETETLSLRHSHAPGAESDRSDQWQVPSPHHLRTLLTAMDANLFAQHVIALAFQALHTTYPEWHEGLTFNAHLANHLRRMRMQR
jgi:hypothetical protein